MARSTGALQVLGLTVGHLTQLLVILSPTEYVLYTYLSEISHTDSTLNRLLIVLCVVIVIVTSFFLFFWNRLLGWLLGFIFRTLLWKSANIWIDMG